MGVNPICRHWLFIWASKVREHTCVRGIGPGQLRHEKGQAVFPRNVPHCRQIQRYVHVGIPSVPACKSNIVVTNVRRVPAENDIAKAYRRIGYFQEFIDGVLFFREGYRQYQPPQI
jgi:hypothetical protein